MTDPFDISPHWIEERANGNVTKAHVVISLGPPNAHPNAPDTKLLLEIEEGEDDNLSLDRIMGDDVELTDTFVYRWHLSVDEDEAGFEEGEFEGDISPNLEEAKRNGWQAVVTFLRGEGYADVEIKSGT